MGEVFIPSFYTLLHKHPKQGAQSSIGHFNLAIGLGMTGCAKLEMSPHLPSQGKPKVTLEFSVPI